MSAQNWPTLLSSCLLRKSIQACTKVKILPCSIINHSFTVKFHLFQNGMAKMISLELSKTFMYLTTREFKTGLEVALVKTALTVFTSVSDSSSVGEISPAPFTLSNNNIEKLPTLTNLSMKTRWLSETCLSTHFVGLYSCFSATPSSVLRRDFRGRLSSNLNWVLWFVIYLY